MSYEDNAGGEEPAPEGATLVSDADVHAEELECGFDINGDGHIGAPPVEPAPTEDPAAPVEDLLTSTLP